MAIQETAVFNLDVNTSGTQKADKELASIKERLEGIEDDIRNVDKASRESKAAENFAKLNKVVDDSVLSIQELGTAADNYKNIAIAAGTETPIGQQALQRAAELEREMSQLTRTVDNLAERGRGLGAALEIGTGVLAGFSAFEGIQALAGDESEELTQTLVKLQAAQSALLGIEELRNTLTQNSIIVTKAKNAVDKAQLAVTNGIAKAQKLLNSASGGVVAAFTAIAAVGAGLVALFDNLSSSGDDLARAQEAINKAQIEGSKAAAQATTDVEVLVAVIKDENRTLEEQEEALKQLQELDQDKLGNLTLEAVKRGEATDALEDYIGSLERQARVQALTNELTAIETEILEAEREAREAAAGSGLDMSAVYEDKIIPSLEKNKRAILDQIAAEKDFTGAIKERETATEDAAETSRKALEDQLKKNEEFFKKQAEEAKKQEEQRRKEAEQARKKAEEEKKKAEEEARKKAEEEAVKALELARTIEDLKLSQIQDADLRQLSEFDVQSKREREALKKKFGEDSELLAQLDAQQAQKRTEILTAIEKKRTDERIKLEQEEQNRVNESRRAQLEADLILAEEDFQASLEVMRQRLALEREIELQNTELTESQRNEIEARFARERATLDEMERDRRIANINTVLDVQRSVVSAAASIGEIAIKNEEKAAKFNAITTAANMAIDSAGAIVAAVKASAGVPFPANIPAIATAVATVLANVATAVKAFRQANAVNAPSLDQVSPGGAGGGISGIDLAETSGVGGETTTDIAALIGEQSKSVRVQLLESDVTDAQARAEVREDISTV